MYSTELASEAAQLGQFDANQAKACVYVADLSKQVYVYMYVHLADLTLAIISVQTWLSFALWACMVKQYIQCVHTLYSHPCAIWPHCEGMRPFVSCA